MQLFKFINARDRDWPIRSKWLIVFDLNTEYKLNGKTHGIRSHAIKHLYEFDFNLFMKYIEKIKSILTVDNCYLYSYKKVKKLNSISEINWRWLLNTLDYINDKIETNQKLNSIEKKIVPILDDMVNQYEKIISKNMKGINIDDKSEEEINNLVTKKKTIIFTATQGKFNITVYLNFDNYTLIIKDNNKNAITTMFNLKSLEKMKKWCNKKMSRDMIVSPDIYNYFVK